MAMTGRATSATDTSATDTSATDTSATDTSTAAASSTTSATARTSGPSAVRRLLGGPAALRRLALASVLANVIVVVTGGAVRLTNSGLGCPTWPSCTTSSLTPTRAYAIHGIIEFANRQLTFVLTLVAVATWAAAMVQRRERRLATVAVLGIPAQAVLGGLTVLTHLNPWLVGAHFLLSTALIAVTFRLWWQLTRTRPRDPGVLAHERADPDGRAARATMLLNRAVLLVTAATLTIGTVVTGSGPHAGDKTADGIVHRNGLQASSMAQLHADSVMVLIGLTVGLVALTAVSAAGRSARRAAGLLLAVELAQGVLGYLQYFLRVPPLLVGLHMFGACLVWLAALNVVFGGLRSGDRRRRGGSDSGPLTAGRDAAGAPPAPAPGPA